MTDADLRDAAHGETRSGARQRFERIHRVLRDRICLLEYGPGARLSEVELAREFGISRTPVRRVLGRLEAEGWSSGATGSAPSSPTWTRTRWSKSTACGSNSPR